MWPGQFVNVQVEVDTHRDVVAVPITVVQQGDSGPFAFVVGPDRIVQKRTIKVGVMNKTTAVIDSGLVLGERVVTDGQSRIQAGSLVDPLRDPAETPSQKSVGASDERLGAVHRSADRHDLVDDRRRGVPQVDVPTIQVSASLPGISDLLRRHRRQPLVVGVAGIGMISAIDWSVGSTISTRSGSLTNS
jgi:hypothetical protein